MTPGQECVRVARPFQSQLCRRWVSLGWVYIATPSVKRVIHAAVPESFHSILHQDLTS